MDTGGARSSLAVFQPQRGHATTATANRVASPHAAQQHRDRPHSAGGYALAGPLLPHTLRYANEADAVSYAHHKCREKGGRVVVLDAHGRSQFTEHAHAEGSGWRLLNECRADRR